MDPTRLRKMNPPWIKLHHVYEPDLPSDAVPKQRVNNGEEGKGHTSLLADGVKSSVLRILYNADH